jgi:hypothetical protein
MGKMPDDALVLPRWDGSPRSPNSVTKEWIRALRELKLPAVSLHALRHTHASQLIASGMDVVTISRRLGHGSPTITLGVYGHLFSNTDEQATQMIETAFGRAITERETKLAFCGGNPVAIAPFHKERDLAKCLNGRRVGV